MCKSVRYWLGRQTYMGFIISRVDIEVARTPLACVRAPFFAGPNLEAGARADAKGLRSLHDGSAKATQHLNTDSMKV